MGSDLKKTSVQVSCCSQCWMRFVAACDGFLCLFVCNNAQHVDRHLFFFESHVTSVDLTSRVAGLAPARKRQIGPA